MPAPVPPFFLKRPCHGGKKWPVQMNLPFFAVKAYVPGGGGPESGRKKFEKCLPAGTGTKIYFSRGRADADLFSLRFREGISFPNSLERSIPRVPLSKLRAVPFALQKRALFEGEKRKGAERRRGRGVANEGGRKEKRTRENRSGWGGPKTYRVILFVWVGHTPSTAGTFRKKFRKNSGKTPETLSERFLESPSRVRLGCPKPYNSRHLRLPERFQNSIPPSTAGDASFFRNWFGRGLSELVMEFPAVLGVFLIGGGGGTYYGVRPPIQFRRPQNLGFPWVCAHFL